MRRFSPIYLALLVCGLAQAAPLTESDINNRATAWLGQLTLDEKIQLVHGTGMPPAAQGGASYIPGVPRLGIPSLSSADSAGGVVGVTAGRGRATVLPSTLALAASWDTGLAYRYGRQIAKEARALGIGEVLGGGVNLAREPRNGRTFEYLGEDPWLAGLLAVQRIKGTQSEQVIATIKHFTGNEQEAHRSTSNSIIDERALRELYLVPFELAVKQGDVGNVMCSYNLLNGEKSCQNKTLLTDILKQEWGFTGVVQSDWINAVTDTVAAANAGLDEEEAGSLDDYTKQYGVFSQFNQRLKQAVQAGTVPQSRLDDMVWRKLRVLVKYGIADNPPKAGGVIDTKAGRALAQQVAEQSMVLLKNQANVLPLGRQVKSIVLIGGHADAGVLVGGGSGGQGWQTKDDAPLPDNAVPCLKPGATVGAEGVAACAYWAPSSPLKAIQARAPWAKVWYVDGRDAHAAAEAAAKADVAIVFATQWSSESMDLPSLTLPDATSDPANQAYDQNALIDTVARHSKRTVVVLEHATAVTMPWLGQVNGVVAAWYPGVSGGQAISRVLFGDVNPSGRLPLTFPVAEADLPQPAIDAAAADVAYREGLFIGYRWYDARQITPLFPFGYGLSYTRFQYSGLKVASIKNGGVTVSFNLTNTGKRAGAEVAQVYARLPSVAGEPPRRLVGWQKVSLKPGQSRRVSVVVPWERLSVWNVPLHQWQMPAGQYGVSVGASSGDTAPLQVKWNRLAEIGLH